MANRLKNNHDLQQELKIKLPKFSKLVTNILQHSSNKLSYSSHISYNELSTIYKHYHVFNKASL
jgi:hypothetical protein